VDRSRTIRVVLLRDRGVSTGHGIALITTDLQAPATQLFGHYAVRWSIEVAFADADQHSLGPTRSGSGVRGSSCRRRVRRSSG
jgi:hypothetical protein